MWLLALLALALSRLSQPFLGITYIDRVETTPRPLHMRIVQIDLKTPGIRFKVSPPAGRREVVRETTVDFLRREHAQVGINAHFFLPFPSEDPEAWVIGLAASDGTVYSAFEYPEQDFAIVDNAPALNIDRRNHAAIVHRDLRRADGRHVREPVALWNTIAGSAQIVSNGSRSIPPLAWYEALAARTVVGLSRDGRVLTLFTVDGRGDSEGMRVSEVADLLVREYGVWNALNLDGGGSTSLAMEDPATHEVQLLNTTAGTTGERAVGSSLAVFARPPRR
jgi:exopolysaccharide biosynthesis protein